MKEWGNEGILMLWPLANCAVLYGDIPVVNEGFLDSSISPFVLFRRLHRIASPLERRI
jgi:hypothetical protein